MENGHVENQLPEKLIIGKLLKFQKIINYLKYEI